MFQCLFQDIIFTTRQKEKFDIRKDLGLQSTLFTEGRQLSWSRGLESMDKTSPVKKKIKKIKLRQIKKCTGIAQMQCTEKGI